MKVDSIRLRELRSGRRISQETLAEVIGKSKPSYIKKENGDVKFNPNEILALSNFYNLTFAEMDAIFFDNMLPNGNIETLTSILFAFGLIDNLSIPKKE